MCAHRFTMCVHPCGHSETRAYVPTVGGGMLPEPARMHTYTHTSTCARAHTVIHTSTCASAHTFPHVRVHTHSHTYTSTCTHTQTHFHMCTCVHTHSHTCQPLVRVKPITSQSVDGWQVVSTVLGGSCLECGLWASNKTGEGPEGTLLPQPHHVPHHLPRTWPSGSC